MKVLLNQKDCVLFSPIAPGNEKVMQHPDHFLVREAVVKAAHDLAVSHTKDICQIYFGEDQPYTNSSPETSAKAIAKFTKRLGIPDTDKYTYPIDAKAKWNVVGSSYHSQVDLDDTYKDGAVILNRTTESLYKWNPENYAKVHTDPSCKGLDFCKY